MALMTYDELRPRLGTGDLVLFSGKGGLSAGIKWATGSPWSHIAMVYSISEHDMVLLWEATTPTNVADVNTGEPRDGVQMVPLSDRLRKYNGDFAFRLLDLDVTGEMLTALQRFRSEVKARPYEKDKIELVKAAYDGPFGKNQEDLSSLFCSELIAEAYQRMGLLPFAPNDKPSNEYVPGDFSSEAGLTLLKGELSKEILLGLPEVV